jgi:alanyl-tRNA synthetase
MMDAKTLKATFREKASRDYRKYFAIDVLEEKGFARSQCTKCGKYFWSVDDREVCGDPDCEGGYSFIGESPARSMDYIETWKEFSRSFDEMGYPTIPRYPVVARWRDDTDFVQASIYDFQPHVVSGAVSPPANPLVVPQFCLRFNDTDNVGVSGRSFTGFVMIGQHAFTKKDAFDQEKYFRDIYRWLTEGMQIPRSELVFHEDGWAGGGNFGPCMEFFSRGVELGNQVYILYELTPSGSRELDLKVLDMGAGQERFTWYSQGSRTIYDPVFPTVLDHLYDRSPHAYDFDLFTAFAPHSGMLNADENEDMQQTWADVASRVGTDVNSLREAVMPIAATYSIADHSRSLLFALADGALPSNVGGGYNLRVLFRRAQYFIEKYGIDTTMGELCRLHADYLAPEFPFSEEALDDVERILKVEEEKYGVATTKARKSVRSLLEKGKVTNEKLIELYDSQGVTPEMVCEQAAQLGVSVSIPPDFYNQVTERQQASHKESGEKREFQVSLPGTRMLYYECEEDNSFDATVLWVKGRDVVLDKTLFYPEGGGQAHDLGKLSGIDVVSVQKYGAVIVHTLDHEPRFSVGDSVKGHIYVERRQALTRHHTATHIINAAAKSVLGNHVWQAGAEKTPTKARLDITHYASLTDEEFEQIELLANSYVLRDLPVTKTFMDRDEAEKRYGFRIYQGGAVPGNVLRIVAIDDLDVEACGGTHCSSTSEIGPIKLIRSEKIQDGIVRLEYAAGLQAIHVIQDQSRLVRDAAHAFRVEPSQLVSASERFFSEWKEQRKEIERLKAELAEMKRSSLSSSFVEKDGLRHLIATIEGDQNVLRNTAFSLSDADTVVVLSNGKLLMVVCGAQAQERGYQANEVIRSYGKGGGNAEFAQGVLTGELPETGA